MNLLVPLLLLASGPPVGDRAGCEGVPDSIPAAVWAAEFRALRDTITRNHADAYRFTSRERLDRLGDSIGRIQGSRSPEERVFAWAAWVAVIGDGHTRLLPFAQPDGAAFRSRCQYPIDVGVFDDGMFVTAAVDSLAALLGAEVLTIGAAGTGEVLDRMAGVIPHDNVNGVLRLAPRYVVSHEANRFIGTADAEGLSTWTFRLRDGTVRAIRMGPTGEGRHPLKGQGGRSVADAFREASAFSWHIESPRSLVFQVNQMANSDEMRLDTAAARVLTALDSLSPRRVILDLRYNGGGNAELLRPFLEELARRQADRRVASVVVLIGRGSFSAAVWNALDAVRTNHAVLIGQPTAGRPNGFGETRWAVLPRTGLRFSWSTQWNQRSSPEDTRTSVTPIIGTPFRFADVVAGKDATLQAALDMQ